MSQTYLAKVVLVYGLLLLSKQFCHRYQTRTYIRLLVETLSPSPQCMRTPVPIWVDGLYGLKHEQVSPGWISLSEQGLFAELGVVISLCAQIYAAASDSPWSLSYAAPCVSSAQAVRAFLFASATAARPYPARWINAQSQRSLGVLGSFNRCT